MAYTADETLSSSSYKKVLDAIKAQSKVATAEGAKQLEWATQYYTDAQNMNLDIIGDLDKIREWGMASQDADRQRLEGTFYALEDKQIADIATYQKRAADFDAEAEQLKAEAIQYKSEANQQYLAGKAVADVGQAFAQERSETERALTDMGVNPNSGASMSLTAGLRMAEGQAQAAAGTLAADAARKEGEEKYMAALGVQETAGKFAESALNLQKGMVDVGRTYPEQITAEGEQARAAGAQAVDQTNAIAAQYTQSAALGADWAQIADENTKTWVDTIDTKFQNKLGVEDSDQKQQELDLKEQELAMNESSGIGSALGTAAGIFASFALNKGGVVPHLADGGLIGGGVADPDLSSVGGSTGNYTPTGPKAAASQPQPGLSSPAVGGSDTVPARLTPGEFVIPQHVVDWKGQEFFQKLIKGAPQQKQQMIAQTGAKPSVRPAGALPLA